MALALAIALMLTFRTLAFSIHSVTGSGLEPLYHQGDRLLVNRCCYGVRIAGNLLLPYSRLMRRPLKRGDVVVFTAPDGKPEGLFIARCAAIPGDTILTTKGLLTVPGLKTCADGDYYWMEAINSRNPVDSRHLGFIHESNIIGRVDGVIYNRNGLFSPLPPFTQQPSPITRQP